MHGTPLKTSRILFLGVFSAQILALGVAFALRQQLPADAELAQLLGYVAAGILAAVLALVQVIRGQMATWMKENADEALGAVRAGKVPGRVHALAIVQAAALETPAVVSGVALAFGAPLALAAIPLTTLVVTLWLMPRASSLERMAQD